MPDHHPSLWNASTMSWWRNRGGKSPSSEWGGGRGRMWEGAKCSARTPPSSSARRCSYVTV
jgi:hypothetical protein